MSLQGTMNTAPKITQQWIECQQLCMNSIDFFDYRDPWNSTDELYVDILDENLSVDDEIYVAETFYEDGEPFEEFNSARSLNYCKVRCLDNYLIAICKKYRLPERKQDYGMRLLNAFLDELPYEIAIEDRREDIQCKMMTAVQEDSDQLACNLTNLLAPDECYPIRHAIEPSLCFGVISHQPVDDYEISCTGSYMGNITVFCDAESGRTNYNESACYKLESQSTECTAMVEDFHVFGDALGYNITACPELFIHKRMGQIHFIGKGFSFLLLLTAFIIFFLIRSVRCWRNTIHWNLITSLICQLTTESTLAYLVRKHIDINNSYPWICRLLYSAQNYFQLCMYHWLLVEGIYLYVMVGVVYNTARVKMWMYKILGWGTPAVIVSLWAVFASYVMEDQCWMSPSPIEWIRRAPILMILATNLFILLNIIRILITQGNTRMINQNKPSEVQQALKATLLLSPLLGMTYVIFLVNPNTDPETSGFHVFAYINSVLSGFQGAFVSIFYCFFNSETQRHLKLPVRIKASRRITNSFCSRYARIKYLRQTLSLLFPLNINKLGPKRKFYGMQRRISNRRAKVRERLNPSESRATVTENIFQTFSWRDVDDNVSIKDVFRPKSLSLRPPTVYSSTSLLPTPTPSTATEEFLQAYIPGYSRRASRASRKSRASSNASIGLQSNGKVK